MNSMQENFLKAIPPPAQTAYNSCDSFPPYIETNEIHWIQFHFTNLIKIQFNLKFKFYLFLSTLKK